MDQIETKLNPVYFNIFFLTADGFYHYDGKVKGCLKYMESGTFDGYIYFII
jgi:hypothetical protein